MKMPRIIKKRGQIGVDALIAPASQPPARRPGDLLTGHRWHDRSGQSLAEFAIVFPILFLLLAAVIQFGLIFWTQNTLTQIARDTGRYAATQQVCNTGAARTDILNTAKSIAASSSLLGYNGSWTSPANVSVTWNGSPCPPVGNQQVVFVHITINHTAPVFFTFLPISGNLSTDAEFRMEPVAD